MKSLSFTPSSQPIPTKHALNPIWKKVISFRIILFIIGLAFKNKNKSKKKQLISESDLRRVLWELAGDGVIEHGEFRKKDTGSLGSYWKGPELDSIIK